MVGVYSLDGVKDINFDDMIDQLCVCRHACSLALRALT
jgi:hypothetical protein